MRPEPNNEIDLLLRQLSRRNGAPVSEFDEQHLDADELNSYVANALPSAARARYTEHLADCSSCRELVVQLSAAQGPVVTEQSGSVVARSGLMSFLASLFSPMVLRYAVPALGLIVVAAIGFVTLRQNRKAHESVAQLTNESGSSPALSNKSVPEQTPASSDFRADSTRQKASDEEKPAAPAPARSEVANDAPVVATKPAEASGTGTTAAAESPPAPKVSTSIVEQEKSADLQKQKKEAASEETAIARDAARARADDASKNEAGKTEARGQREAVTVAPNAATKRNLELGGAKAGVAGAPSAGRDDYKRTPEKDKDASQAKLLDEGASETRSVGGRRFNKKGGVWIDTAYSSQSTFNVTRGSEQYRALIADEPSIRTIAEQLDGEVIVVWKGRAYHIR